MPWRKFKDTALTKALGVLRGIVERELIPSLPRVFDNVIADYDRRQS